MHPSLPEAMAAERRRELMAAAAHQRLVAQAICCRPSTVACAATRVRGAWAALTARRGTVCCATA
ncbi:hypothetical protein [Jiangella gansuensis]|uniref:hypothetical protein n=1 Tax=Jiangella gansuensis TaxID=281473 RepID=UPI00047D1F93|nr:hypothetical protein [Jiangella gansuensis]